MFWPNKILLKLFNWLTPGVQTLKDLDRGGLCNSFMLDNMKSWPEPI